MKRSILGSHALRAACACALALGIAPAAAWGAADGEQPASDVDALQEVVEDVSQEDDGEMPEKGAPSPDDDANSEAADEQAPGEGADDDGDENGAPEAEKGEGDSIPDGEPEAEPEAQPGDAAPTAQPLSETETGKETGEPSSQASDIQITLDRNVINLKAFKCPFDDCMYGYHYEDEETGEEEIAFGLSQPLPEGYNVLFKYDEFDGYSLLEVEGQTGVIPLNPVRQPGSYSGTLLVTQTDEFDYPIGDPLATATVSITTSEVDYNGTITPIEGVSLVEGEEYPNFLQSLFSFSGHARVVYGLHAFYPFDEITSSNPAVFDFQKSSVHVPGCTESVMRELTNPSAGSTVITVKSSGGSFSRTVTVGKWSDLNYGALKFKQHEFTLVSGHSLGGSIAHYKWVTGSENVKDSFYVASSDDSVVTYLPSYPVDTIEDLVSNHDWAGAITLTARRPGTAKLNLYFYNPATKESVLTDSMTVNVTAPQTIGSSTPGSAFQGDIVSSGDVDSVVKQEGLSLSTSLKSAASLSSDQRAGLTEVIDTAKGEKAVLVDISLLRSDGTAFDRYDELAEQYEGIFTVRLKIDGDLATLDPDTIRTYRIGEDGEMEPITCWVHDGYLYITTWHFSPYAIVGQAKSATGDNTGGTGNGSQGGNAGAGDTQGGGTTTAADKGDANDISTAKNNAAKASGATRSDTPLAQTGDSLLPLGAALGLAAILGVFGFTVARRRMNRQE